jgi:hypothetical protein
MPLDLQAISSAAAILGRKGGKSKSKAKSAAARRNGRKGGRPRKIPAALGVEVEAILRK